MKDKSYQVCVFVGEELDDIFWDESESTPVPFQSTKEMRARLRNNIIDQGYLELITLH